MSSVFKRLMIASDLTEMDDQLFAFTEKLMQHNGVEKIYLLHVIPDFQHPKDVDLDFHQRFTEKYPIDEKVRDLLAERMKDFFIDQKQLIDINIIEGRPYHQLLHWIDIKEVDLVVVGHKLQSKGSGITAKRLARKAKASVALVSNQPLTDIQKILVPIDLSDHSVAALKKALLLKQNRSHPVQIQALHVVGILPTDHYYGLSLNKEFLASLVSNATTQLNEFFKRNQLDNLGIDLEVVPNTLGSISRHIHQQLQRETPDLLIMGAKGQSFLEHILIGSVTEDVVNTCQNTAIIIVR